MSSAELGARIASFGGDAFIGFKDSAATDGVDERGKILASQTSVEEGVRRIEALGIRVKERFEGRAVVLATVRPDLVDDVLAVPLVDYLEPLVIGRFQSVVPVPEVEPVLPVAASQVTPWGVTKVDAPAAWSYSTGTGVKVQYLDSGTDSAHTDLAVAVHHGSCQQEHPSSFDYLRHGTQIAGVIGALDNTQMVVGVAPGASLWSSKVSHGGFPTALAIRCALQFGRANGVRVISMSFGMPPNTTVTDEINGAYYQDDIVVVAAAGNTNGAAVTWPATLSSVIAVTAINQSDIRPSFTAIGAKVELAAPGAGVVTTNLGNTVGDTLGTSIAAPHVAGAAAVLRAYNPSWSAPEVRRRLAVGAVDLSPVGRDIYTGFGRLNVLAGLLAPAPNPASVAISGPTMVRPGSECTWEAAVGGGVSPFAFEWYAGYENLLGSQFVSFESSGYSHGDLFKLSVTVTGADLASSEATLWVAVDSNAPLCWN